MIYNTNLKLLAMLDKECETPEGKGRMHRLGHYVCGEDGRFRQDLERHIAGYGLTVDLHVWLVGYEAARMDEAEVERPHADVQRIVDHANASEFLWWASTVRLKQNLDVYNLYLKNGQAQLFHKWFENDKSILQFNLSKYQKLIPCKLNRSELYCRIYNLDKRSLEDWSSFSGLYDSVGPYNLAKASNDVQWLKKDYMEAVLDKSVFYTLPGDPVPSELLSVGVPSESTDIVEARVGPDKASTSHSARVFEVLGFDPSRRVLHYDVDMKSCVMPLVIQRHEIYCPNASPLDASFEQPFLLVFPVGLPEVVDGISFAPWGKLFRNLTKWTVDVSDWQGCLSLTEPRRASDVNLPLTDLRYPAVLMLEHLRKLGYKSDESLKMHTDMLDMRYCGIKLANRKSYLRCVLSLQILADRGLDSLSTSQHEMYYRAVLGSAKPGEIRLSAHVRDYKALLDDDNNNCEAYSFLALEDVPARIRRQPTLAVTDAPIVVDDSESEDDAGAAGTGSGKPDGAPSLGAGDPDASDASSNTSSGSEDGDSSSTSSEVGPTNQHDTMFHVCFSWYAFANACIHRINLTKVLIV